jgi:CheY-like chemotaxis protein
MSRILVVDDSQTIRKVVGNILESAGFDVAFAVDGQDAIEALKGGEVAAELVLVDFVMPRMNGFQFCRALRAEPNLTATPVVLMSAKADRIRDHFVQQTGAIDAITKPFDADALLAIVQNAIRRVQSGRVSASMLPTFDDDESSVEGKFETQAPPAARGPALEGDLSVIPIGAILQLLQVEGQSGVLRTTDDARTIEITFRGGVIDLVRGEAAGDEFRIGRYFLERGLLTEDDLEDFIVLTRQGSDEPTPPLGVRLLQAGKIDEINLRAALIQQSSELVYELVRWQKGQFTFRRQPLGPLAEHAKLGLAVAQVVMEGFRRVDEWRVIEGTLGSFDAVLVQDTAAVHALREIDLSPTERAVLAVVDGDRSIREIIASAHMSAFDVCRILGQLLSARLVRKQAPQTLLGAGAPS